VAGIVARCNNAAIGNVVGISDPITKLCNIKELAKDQLAKILAKKTLFAEKEASVEETTQIVPEVVKRTHSQISGGMIGEKGYQIRGHQERERER
jgi:hypothetical protein